MKRLVARLTWWIRLPHKGIPRPTPQKGTGRRWTIVAMLCHEGKARFPSLPKWAPFMARG
jgi:hypothetical protein